MRALLVSMVLVVTGCLSQGLEAPADGGPVVVGDAGTDAKQCHPNIPVADMAGVDQETEDEDGGLEHCGGLGEHCCIGHVGPHLVGVCETGLGCTSPTGQGTCAYRAFPCN